MATRFFPFYHQLTEIPKTAFPVFFPRGERGYFSVSVSKYYIGSISITRSHIQEVHTMPNTTKQDLIAQVAKKTGMSQVDTRIAIESFIDAISDSLQQGNNIELRGFGRFKVKPRAARTARNPRTGETVDVPAGLKPTFYASRKWTELMNE
jgi:DNA-binding protein HU-beta/integration host factor subunit beta